MTHTIAPRDGPDLDHCKPVDLTIVTGKTLLEILHLVLPGATECDLDQVRIVLHVDGQIAIVSRQYWATVRPKPGVEVFVQLVPGKDVLRSALLAIVSIAATALAPVLASGLGAFGLSALTAGLSVVGGLLVNALIPVEAPDAANETPAAGRLNSLSGWNNQVRLDQPVPAPFGRSRFAPPFAATSYSEIVGSEQYIRAVFCLGYGRLAVSDIRFGDTSMSDYDDVEFELLTGAETDGDLALVAEQVLEQAEPIELVNPLPRDSAGNIIPGPPDNDTAIVRQTATDTGKVSLIFTLSNGLYYVGDDGGLLPIAVDIQIRQRRKGEVEWSNIQQLHIAAATNTPFFRQHTWDLPDRSTWEIEVFRMTGENTSTRTSDSISLAAIQSIRPEHPVNFDKPVALLAIRVRATYQLSGTLQNVNAIVEPYGLVWNGTAWVEGLSRNPATAFIRALQGPMNPFPVDAGNIDWANLADWFEFCADKGLKFDFVAETAQSLGDLLRIICAAGRAAHRYDGARWGVIVDRPETRVIDHISPRNSSEFSWTRPYFEPPDGFRVAFADETNDFEPAERIIPWPGFEGDVELTESLPLPGKVDPDEIWIEARRRQYELIHRSDSFSAIQPRIAPTASRGSVVMASLDVLDNTQLAARVRAVRGVLIEIDAQFEMTEGVSYGLRFRGPPSLEEDLGPSIVRSLVHRDGPHSSLILQDKSSLPAVGELVHLGEMGSDSFELKVRGMEGGENFSSVLDMVAAAPIIDTLTDAEVPPVWSGRVGAIVNTVNEAPRTPTVVSVTTTGSYVEGGSRDDPASALAGSLTVMLSPGSGSAVPVATYRLETRLEGETEFAETIVPVAQGSVTIETYITGATVEFRVASLSADGMVSPLSSILTVIIGDGTSDLPLAIEEGAIVAAGGLGVATLQVAIGDDATTTEIQVYRTLRDADLNTLQDAIADPQPVSTSSTVTIVDGDMTRLNLVTNAEFNAADGWSTSGGWSIAGGVATHNLGTVGALSQSLPLNDGSRYRIAAAVGGTFGAGITPSLSGGSTVSGTVVTAAGVLRQTLTAAAGNDGFSLTGASDFDGTVDDIVIFEESAASIPAGEFDYYVAPLNEDGLQGPISGPFPVDVS